MQCLPNGFNNILALSNNPFPKKTVKLVASIVTLTTFVSTNVVNTIMTIEEAIKSTRPMEIRNKTLINLMYTSRHLEQRFTHIKSFDLTMQQYNVLRILRGQKGNPANLSTIQERMIDKSSNTTRLIDKLLAKDLVSRQVCPTNRRKIEVFITTKGLDLLAAIDPVLQDSNNAATKQLSETEMEQLNFLLDKLRND